MPNRSRRAIFLILAAIALIVLLVNVDARFRNLDQALQIMAHIKMRYVEPVSTPELFRAYLRTGTIEGMLATLEDPYTRFLTPAEYRELKIQTDGTFGGIGVILDHPGDNLVILRVIEGSPGMKAGLRRGDLIIKVNGRPTAEMSSDEAVAAIRGPAGSSVTLTISRGQGKQLETWDVRIQRANIKLPSLDLEIKKDPQAGPIAHITIMQFAERTPSELEEALAEAERNHVHGVILDLRYNPGGLLDSAIGVAGKFLDGGVVMYMLRRNGQRRPYYAEPGDAYRYPLVVLVNEWSASASEIVAGALQDRRVAKLVGAKTFGKGVVQEIIPVGRGAALSVTVAKYLTAGGRSINKVGIEPDVQVGSPGTLERILKAADQRELERLEKMQLDKAMEILRAELALPAAAAS